jgi:hypothetical protein
MTDVGCGPPDHAIDIGDGHRIVMVKWQHEICGVNCWHLTAEGTWCVGWAPFSGSKWAAEFNGKISTWDVVQNEPLTMSPSLLCRACKDHGFIRDGRWVRA